MESINDSFFRFVSVLDGTQGSTIILDKIGLSKSDLAKYEALEEILTAEWSNCNNDERQTLKIGDFAFVFSESLNRPSRAIVHDITGPISNPGGKFMYTLFHCDYGVIEKVIANGLVKLHESLKELPARSVMVTLFGLLPAKPNPMRKFVKTVPDYVPDILWQKTTVDQIRDWLSTESPEGFRVKKLRHFHDYAIVGDVYRLVEYPEPKKDSLIDFLLKNNLALMSNELVESQFEVESLIEKLFGPEPTYELENPQGNSSG